MRPQKPKSAVVPVGPNMKVQGDPNESYCRYCQANLCPMRQEPQLHWQDRDSRGPQWWWSIPSPTVLSAVMISSRTDGLCSAQALTSPKDPASIIDP